MSHLNKIPPRQRGVSLVIVLILMLLSGLLVMGGARVTHLNEFMAGSDTDHQRTFEAAQMMLQNAELDIQAIDGQNRRTVYVSKMDPEDNEKLAVLASGQSGSVKCVDGVCSDLGVLVNGNDRTETFWNRPALFKLFKERGATYRQWTHPSTLSAGSEATSNPILAATNPARAWYWIELLEYSEEQRREAPDWVRACVPAKATSADGTWLFRITAIAEGRSGAPTVVQEYFVPKPQEDGVRRCPA